jgi:hypothetical protein
LIETIQAVDASSTGRRRHVAGENAHGGGFAGTIGSQESDHFSSFHLETHIPDARQGTVIFCEPFSFYHEIHSLKESGIAETMFPF